MKIKISLTTDKGEEYVGEVELTKISEKHQKKKIINVKDNTGKEDKSKPQYSIEKIYNEGFFKDAKKLRDVTNNLKTRGFNFKRGSVQYALDRADFLDRSGNQGNYKWIQKYPST